MVTKKWAAEHPRTLAAFYRALEQGQQIADVSRAAAEQAMVDMPAPFGVSAETAAVMAWTAIRSAPGRSAACPAAHPPACLHDATRAPR